MRYFDHRARFVHFKFEFIGQNIIIKTRENVKYFSHEQFQSYFVYVWDVSYFSSPGFFVSSFSFFPSWREAYQPTKILYFIASLFALLINTNVWVFTQKGRNVYPKSFLVSNISKAAMFLGKRRVIYFMHADSVYLKCKNSHKKPKTNLVITTTSTCNGYFLESTK